jgi:hypothetical protein
MRSVAAADEKVERPSDLVGHWIFVSCDDYYRVGHVEQSLGEGTFYLVRMRPMTGGPPVKELLSLDDMEGAQFFDDERALDAWLAWLERDDGPKIVEMKK